MEQTLTGGVNVLQKKQGKQIDSFKNRKTVVFTEKELRNMLKGNKVYKVSDYKWYAFEKSGVDEKAMKLRKRILALELRLKQIEKR